MVQCTVLLQKLLCFADVPSWAGLHLLGILECVALGFSVILKLFSAMIGSAALGLWRGRHVCHTVTEQSVTEQSMWPADFDAPVKLLDSMMHSMADEPDQQVVVLSQVGPSSHSCLSTLPRSFSTQQSG